MIMAILNHTNGLLQSFVRGLDLGGSMQGAGGTGGLLVFNDTTSGQSAFYCFDGNGNVTTLASTTNSSVILAKYEYGPFAEPIRQTGFMSSANSFRLSTQFTDDTTGGIKYLYREYAQHSGRWLAKDYIQERGGLNLIEFVKNNPINTFDVFGLSENDVCKIVTNFLRTVRMLCAEGKRCDNGYVNNCLSYSPFHDNMGCGDQAEYVGLIIQGNKHDSWWTVESFEREHLPETLFTIPRLNITFSFYQYLQFPHHWGEAASSNPDAPVIKFYPWHGELTLFYSNRIETYKIKCNPYYFEHKIYWRNPSLIGLESLIWPSINGRNYDFEKYLNGDIDWLYEYRSPQP